MTAKTIKRLLGYLPPDRKRLIRFGAKHAEVEKMPESMLFQQEVAFAYKCLDFGWKYIQEVLRSGIKFPPILTGPDLWLWRTYIMIKTSRKDGNILAALQLAGIHNSLDESKKTIVDALLVAPGMTVDKCARSVSMSTAAVQAYEKLFFDIRDRKVDNTFLTTMLYPQTRMIEMRDDYSECVSLRDLMLRTGYKRGEEYVKFFAGMTDDLMTSFASGQAATQFESMVMAMGLIMTDVGMMNSYKHSRSINYATRLTQAAKQGGSGDEKVDIFENIGQHIRHDLQEHLQPQAELRAKFYSEMHRKDRGVIIDVD